MLTAAALVRFEVDPDWVVAAWAALALALLAVAWRSDRSVFLYHSCFLAFAVLFRAVAHNFYERSYFPAPFSRGRTACVGLTAVLLFLALPFAYQLRSKNQASASSGGPWFRTVLELACRRPEQSISFPSCW